jgi:hypothetical protein
LSIIIFNFVKYIGPAYRNENCNFFNIEFNMGLFCYCIYVYQI